MKQEETKIKISEVIEGYTETPTSVTGFSGLLNIRPEFQREFIYPLDKQIAVIDTILNDCVIGIITWFENDSRGSYELGDGQQRLTSICRFCDNRFTIPTATGPKFFHNLSEEDQKKILGYQLYTVIVSGTAEEKLAWFRRINTAGIVLTEQEMRNASYTGPWLTSAKKYFSQANCPGYNIGAKYISGTLNRQDFLERALSWISGDQIETYMAKHQKDQDATELWADFEKRIKWIQKTFPTYRKELKGLPWGYLYDTYSGNTYDPVVLENDVQKLMADDDVTKKSGIYEYLLSGGFKTKCLSLRTFTDSQKRGAYERQKGICPRCGQHFELAEMEGDHIVPWSKGGKTIPDNLQMLCKKCNSSKSNG